MANDDAASTPHILDWYHLKTRDQASLVIGEDDGQVYTQIDY